SSSFSHSSSSSFSTVTVATVTVQLPSHPDATQPSGPDPAAPVSSRHQPQPVRRPCCCLELLETAGKRSSFGRFSNLSFSLIRPPNQSCEAAEAKLSHRRDLQEVQLDRTVFTYSSVSALDICLMSFGDARTVSARIADQADYGLLIPARIADQADYGLLNPAIDVHRNPPPGLLLAPTLLTRWETLPNFRQESRERQNKTKYPKITRAAFSHSSSSSFSTVTVATVTVQLPSHPDATQPSGPDPAAPVSSRHQPQPVRRPCCCLELLETAGKRSSFGRLSNLSFSLIRPPNQSCEAAEAKLSHRRDLQEVQLDRT
ncbi:LRR and NB-ARC domains-containing disease resistance protein, partial [Prunus dulcis]